MCILHGCWCLAGSHLVVTHFHKVGFDHFCCCSQQILRPRKRHLTTNDSRNCMSVIDGREETIEANDKIGQTPSVGPWLMGNSWCEKMRLKEWVVHIFRAEAKVQHECTRCILSRHQVHINLPELSKHISNGDGGGQFILGINLLAWTWLLWHISMETKYSKIWFKRKQQKKWNWLARKTPSTKVMKWWTMQLPASGT